MPMKLTIVKEFQYRGNDEEWSNSYHFGNSISDATEFGVIRDALVLHEKTCYGPQVSIVRVYGYADESSNHADYTTDYTLTTPIAGTLVPGSSGHRDLPGDCAATVRWGLDRFTSRGKRVYMRKYFHGAWGQPGTNVDELHNGQKDAIEAFADWIQNFDDHGLYCPATGVATILGHAVAENVTIRQLKRRGKRPLASP